MLSAFMTLMPILDFLSDLAMFNVLLAALDYGWAALVLLIIVLSFRFQSLYAALSPKPELVSINLLYVPFLLMPCYERIMGQVTSGSMQDLYDAAKQVDPAHLTVSRLEAPRFPRPKRPLQEIPTRSSPSEPCTGSRWSGSARSSSTGCVLGCPQPPLQRSINHPPFATEAAALRSAGVKTKYKVYLDGSFGAWLRPWRIVPEYVSPP